jgi:hypothetical protein
MSPRYLRNPPRTSDDVSAAVLSVALAASVGLITFYFARLIFAREPMGAEELRVQDRPGQED